ncbi:MAG: protein kinase, partial [Gemmatimonadaceae bacterium]|nr:protein kinase [Gemmatimonadaceae bacterium]
MSLELPFTLLDRYDVTDVIGRGGHATVFRAYDRVLSRHVAIKVLRHDVLSPDLLARFKQEIEITAQLEHAHILHVYDTGELQGQPFVVMELASGRTLAERLGRERQLPVDDALQIAREVGLALAHAHARGVVHRDVKPDNILLGAGGAILADFGIARVTAENHTAKLTSTGIAVGTVQYMSPEQLCAEPIIDGRSDQYSLACVLYEALCGVQPHVSATAEGLRLLRMTNRHTPVTIHRPTIPPHIDSAILRALSSTPADRFRSMDEFVASLGIELSGEYAVRQSRAFERVADVPVRAPARGASRGLTVVVVLMMVAVGAVNVWRDTRAASRSAVPVRTVRVQLDAERGGDSTASRFFDAVAAELSAWPDVRMDDTEADQSLRIRSSVVLIGDSIQLRLRAQHPSTDKIQQASEVLARDGLADAATLSRAVARLVRRSLVPVDPTRAPGLDGLPDRSLPALHAYVRGFTALREGRLADATSAFQEAAGASGGFAHAHFWAAQAGLWSTPRAPAAWLASGEAAVGLGVFHGLDSLLAVGLLQQLRGDFPDAQRTYQRATALDATSYVAWMGLGETTRLDSTVVNAADGPQFRSSHWSALMAYRRLMETAPTAEWIASVFGGIRNTTYASAG